MRRHVVPSVVLVALLLCSCVSRDAEAVASVRPDATFAGPSRAPQNLPSPVEDRAVSGALERSGIHLSLVGPSKFDWMLGDAARRSAVYTGTIDGTQVRADILFLDVPVDGVTACTEDAHGETKFTVRVHGIVLGTSPVTGTASFPVYFAMNERFFVMTSDARIRDALRHALGLSVPPC